MLAGLGRIHLALTQLGHPGLNVTAFDPDTVSPANIGRQLFYPTDIGLPKTTVLITRINTHFGTQWKAVHAPFKPDYNTDLIISCVDSRKARSEIYQASKQYDSLWMDLGNTQRTGQVLLGCLREDYGLPHPLALFPELGFAHLDSKTEPSCSLAVALSKQDLFINQTIATFALHLVWTMTHTHKIPNQGYHVNLDGSVRPIPLPKNFVQG
jgi:PRTRC genetic system ThiF family protein